MFFPQLQFELLNLSHKASMWLASWLTILVVMIAKGIEDCLLECVVIDEGRIFDTLRLLMGFGSTVSFEKQIIEIYLLGINKAEEEELSI